jgi:predicted nucleotidyltransferase component of viral defense system
MAKRQLSSTEAFDLRQALHVATLEALMASRRWQPGELIFQGGTSLHLTHGSPRYSEDLDFLVKSSLNLEKISAAMQDRLRELPWLPMDTTLVVGNARLAHNPHAFAVTISGPDVIGSVRVMVELWQTTDRAMADIKVHVAPVRLASGLAAGMQTFVPTADLAEIYADKVFALAARPYLKPRDVFDLHWLVNQNGDQLCDVHRMQVRLLTYPNETATAWLAKALARKALLATSHGSVANDLKRWLPSSWPLSETNVAAMIDTALAALEQGMAVMGLLVMEAETTGQKHETDLSN